MISVAFTSLCFIVVILIIGETTNRLLFKNSFNKHFLLRICLAYGLGTGVFSLILFYLMYAGLPLSASIIFFIAAVFAAVFVFNMKHLFSSKPCLKTSYIFLLKQESIRDYFLIFIIVISLALIFFKALFLPMHLPDDRAQWGLKAKILYHEKTIYAESFNDPNRVQLHSGYPFLVPILEASLFSLMKNTDDRTVRIFFPLYFLGLLFFMYSSQRRYASHRHSLLFTAMFSVLPVFIQDVNGNPSSGYADIPLAFYYTVFVISIFNWFESKRLQDLMLAIVFVIFAIFTKQEGLVLWLASAVGILLKILFENKNDILNRYKHLMLYIFLPFVFLIPWFYFKSSLSLSPWEKDWNLTYFSLSYLSSHLDRIPLIFARLAEVCFSTKYWNILWIIFFAVIIFRPKVAFRFPLLFILLLIFFNLSSLLGAVFLYPWKWWPNFLFDMPRLFIFNIPLIIFFISYAVSRDKPLKKV